MRGSREVLVLDDEGILCERVREQFEKRGHRVETFTDSRRAPGRREEKSFAVVVTGLEREGPTGLDVRRFLRRASPGTPGIVLPGYASPESAREAECSGVFEFGPKPFPLPAIASPVRRAARKAARFRPGGGE